MEKGVYKAIGNKPIKDVSSVDILSIMKNTVERVLSQRKHGTDESAANLNRRFIGLVRQTYAVIPPRKNAKPWNDRQVRSLERKELLKRSNI